MIWAAPTATDGRGSTLALGAAAVAVAGGPGQFFEKGGFALPRTKRENARSLAPTFTHPNGRATEGAALRLPRGGCGRAPAEGWPTKRAEKSGERRERM